MSKKRKSKERTSIGTYPPRTLYHYCGLPALLGIAQTKEIWLSNIFFLNDSLEHLWFRRLVENELTMRIQTHALTGKNTKLAAREDGIYRDMFEALQRYGTYSKDFVACFSFYGDQLSQWRGYGDDGHGFAIGFDAARLQHDPAVVLVKVEYDLERQVIKSKDLITYALEMSLDDPDKQGQFVNDFLVSVWEAAAYCKNPDFKEEQEWRLIYRADYTESDHIKKAGGKVRYRSRGRDLIPYFAWPLDTSEMSQPICEVVFGPKNLKPEQDLAVYDLLDESNLPRATIRHSTLSYR